LQHRPEHVRRQALRRRPVRELAVIQREDLPARPLHPLDHLQLDPQRAHQPIEIRHHKLIGPASLNHLRETDRDARRKGDALRVLQALPSRGDRTDAHARVGARSDAGPAAIAERSSQPVVDHVTMKPIWDRQPGEARRSGSVAMIEIRWPR